MKPSKIGELTMGEVFGEIGIINSCPRTASVVARDYGLYGELLDDDVESLFYNHPILEQQMRKQIYSYSDKLRFFLMQALKRVDFMEQAPDDFLLNIAYTMYGNNYEKDEQVFGLNTLSDTMYIVFSGVVSIETEFDSVKAPFVIERLGRGSVLNAHAFLVEDNLDTIGKVISPATLY